MIRKTLPELFSHAVDIASEAHREQKYGTLPYIVHLRRVDEFLVNHGYSEAYELRAAAYLHDVIEDTPMTACDLMDAGFTPYTVALVDAVTRPKVMNRKDGNTATYPRIARMQDAVALKLADRYDNVCASINLSDARRLEMYRAEHFEFSRCLALYAAHLDMWRALEELDVVAFKLPIMLFAASLPRRGR